jgi:hypothetical protein
MPVMPTSRPISSPAIDSFQSTGARYTNSTNTVD